MTRQELLKYIPDLPDGAVITICKSADDIPATIRLTSETIQTEDKKFSIIFLRNAVRGITAVWVFASALLPDWIPAAPKLWIASANLLANINFSFPYFQNANKSLVVFENTLPTGQHLDGVTYIVPPTGIAPNLMP
jgi:hypothetical protein